MENVNLSQDPGLWLRKHGPGSRRPGHMRCFPFPAQAPAGVRGSPGSLQHSLRTGVCELLLRAARAERSHYWDGYMKIYAPISWERPEQQQVVACVVLWEKKALAESYFIM